MKMSKQKEVHEVESEKSKNPLILGKGVFLELYSEEAIDGYVYNFFKDTTTNKVTSAIIYSHHMPQLYDGSIKFSKGHDFKLKSESLFNREVELTITIGNTKDKSDNIGLLQSLYQ